MIKCYKVWLDKGTNPYVEKDLKKIYDSIITNLEYSDSGNVMRIETILISQEEYDNMEEWQGP